MAWKTIIRGAPADNPEAITKPLRFYKDGRIMLTRKWLTKQGLSDRSKITFLVDEDQKIVGLTFIESDLVNSYKLIAPNTKNKSNVHATSLLTFQSLSKFGYKIKTNYALVKDTTDKNVWVIKKEA